MAKKVSYKLAKSSVVFDEREHRYWLGEQQLSGITSILHRTVFNSMYKDVPDEVLNRAADRGSNIHYEVSMWVTAGIEPESSEGKNFVEKIAPQLDLVASEYLVSDDKHVASSIDLVAGIDKGTVHLLDIKSYKNGLKRDKVDYVSWQLSCYAYMFELMNPTLKVGRLSCLWLSDDNAEIIDVNRIDSSEVAAMIDADANDLPYVYGAVASIDSEAVAKYRTFDEEYSQLEARLKELKTLKEQALAEVKDALEKAGCTSVETGGFKFTLVPATTTKRFDSTKFKVENPGVYAAYLKESAVSAYVKVTAR